MPDQKIRVLMVDDHELMRQAYGMYLNDEPDIDVIGYAGDGQEAVAMTAAQKPDVIIMDVRMPKMSGLVAARYIKQASPNVGILFVSASNEYHAASIAVGGDGYLTKPVKGEELLREVRSIAVRHGLCGGGRLCA